MRSRALNDLRLARVRLKKPVRQNLPVLLVEAMAACRLIVEDRGRFPELGSGKGQRRFQFGAPNRERHLRRLEAIAKVLMCLMSHTDLITLRTGRPRPDGSCDAIRVMKPRPRGGRQFVDRRTQSSIEEETGCSFKAVSAALRDLRDAGYVSAHQPRKDYVDEETGERKWRSFPTVHVISKTCFARLGIDLEWLQAERTGASKRSRELPAPIVDIRLRRARQQMVRSQAMAAKRVAARRPSEAEAAAAIRQLQARLGKRE